MAEEITAGGVRQCSYCPITEKEATEFYVSSEGAACGHCARKHNLLAGALGHTFDEGGSGTYDHILKY